MARSVIILMLLSCLTNSSCSLPYLAKQGALEVKMLAMAKPIVEVLRDEKLDNQHRRKLELVLSVRRFAEKELGLSVRNIYANASLDFDHQINAVSASLPLAFKPYTWWFFLLGNVPYKGYFNLRDAEKEAERIKALGYETVIRRVGAYSTLGYLPDPIVKSMLSLSDYDLAELLIHELTHATVYFPGETPFNESFANFFGQQGALLFFKKTYGEKSHEYEQALKEIRYSKEYENFFNDLYADLSRLYDKKINDKEKLAKKLKKLKEAKIAYDSLLKHYGYQNKNWHRVNNAFLISFRQYNNDEGIFLELFECLQKNMQAFLKEVAFFARGDKPFSRLRERVDELKKKHHA